MQKNGPPAVVVGLSITGLGIVRSLAKSGINVIGVDTGFNKPSSHTKYCKKVTCADIDSEDKLLEALILISKKAEVKPVLFLSTDMSVLIASENREILEDYYLFNLPTKSTVQTFMHKTLFAEFARRNSFHIPKTFVANGIEDVEVFAEQVDYPCVLKPSFRQPIWDKSTPVKVFKAQSKEELMNLYRRNSSLANRFVVQEMIPGPDREVYFCLLFYNSLSKPAASLTGRKLVQWMPELGSTCIAEKFDNSIVYNESIRLFDRVSYKGIGSVEFKRDMRDNKFKIMEPTIGRADLQSTIGYHNGVNFPLLEYCDCLNLEAPKFVSKKRKQYWVNEEGLFWFLTSGKVKPSRNELIQVIKKEKAYAFFDLHDIKPFVYFLFYLIRLFIKKLW